MGTTRWKGYEHWYVQQPSIDQHLQEVLLLLILDLNAAHSLSTFPHIGASDLVHKQEYKSKHAPSQERDVYHHIYEIMNYKGQNVHCHLFPTSLPNVLYQHLFHIAIKVLAWKNMMSKLQLCCQGKNKFAHC